MPDYFVPVDTLKYTKYHRALSAKGCIIQTSLRYLDENRSLLVSKYKDIEDFDKRFTVSDAYMAMLREQGVKDSVKLSGGEEEFERSRPELAKQLKMLIARDLWDMSDFMMIYNRTSDNFKKAYELIQVKNHDKLLMKEK